MIFLNEFNEYFSNFLQEKDIESSIINLWNDPENQKKIIDIITITYQYIKNKEIEEIKIYTLHFINDLNLFIDNFLTKHNIKKDIIAIWNIPKTQKKVIDIIYNCCSLLKKTFVINFNNNNKKIKIEFETYNNEYLCKLFNADKVVEYFDDKKNILYGICIGYIME